jgi:hypothetical protein
MAAVRPAQMLHKIGQRPLGAGRHLHVVAGHEGDRCPQASPPASPRPQRAHGHAHVAGHCTGRASGPRECR